MIKPAFVLGALFLALLCVLRAEESPVMQDMSAAWRAMTPWLAEIDGGGYDQSWRDAGESLQDKISLADWMAKLKQDRTPLGPVKKRNHDWTLPKGNLVTFQFTIDFEGGRRASETVTFEKQDDGTWLAADYLFKPQS
ncbi:MAG: DUF4019 domain-containing protein [Verrucomicrobium sp.]|nr:DUF4019 domain-containing protein [Verrucomicrobium sp.]